MPYMCRTIFAKRPNPALVLMVASQMGNPTQHTLPQKAGPQYSTIPRYEHTKHALFRDKVQESMAGTLKAFRKIDTRGLAIQSRMTEVHCTPGR